MNINEINIKLYCFITAGSIKDSQQKGPVRTPMAGPTGAGADPGGLRISRPLSTVSENPRGIHIELVYKFSTLNALFLGLSATLQKRTILKELHPLHPCFRYTLFWLVLLRNVFT